MYYRIFSICVTLWKLNQFCSAYILFSGPSVNPEFTNKDAHLAMNLIKQRGPSFPKALKGVYAMM